jgi:hypothetical protein
LYAEEGAKSFTQLAQYFGKKWRGFRYPFLHWYQNLPEPQRNPYSKDAQKASCWYSCKSDGFLSVQGFSKRSSMWVIFFCYYSNSTLRQSCDNLIG